jgi:hypothetical protein
MPQSQQPEACKQERIVLMVVGPLHTLREQDDRSEGCDPIGEGHFPRPINFAAPELGKANPLPFEKLFLLCPVHPSTPLDTC